MKNYFKFSAGPYNPLRFKQYNVPTKIPGNKEIYQFIEQSATIPSSPVRNIRHINPIRQSGPLPSFEGNYTMDDIMKFYQTVSGKYESHPVQMHPEELMRRAPGLSRKEADFISKIGINPIEQVHLAIMTVNLGLDVFYQPNQMFIARQVVTNSKGEKVEVMWNAQAYEDLAQLNTGFSPIFEYSDSHWELFLWGDIPIKPTHDFDLLVPNTWMEYELENSQFSNIMQDQFNIPEEIREYDVGRNVNCRKELYQKQENLKEFENMMDEEWYPQGQEQAYHK